MSKTFTARPAVARRGRGKMNPRTNTTGRPPWNGSTEAGVFNQAQGQADQQPPNPANQPDQIPNESQTTTYQGGYTMITPNEKKRQQIVQQAERGTKVYEDFKQQKKVTHVSYVGTVGGGCVTENDARQKTIQNQNNAKFDRLQKQQKWREDKKLKENAEYDKKRIEQRQKAESNAQRKQHDQGRLEDKHGAAMRRKNAAFLDRFDQQCQINLLEGASGNSTNKHHSQQSDYQLNTHYVNEDGASSEYEYDAEPNFLNAATGHQNASSESLQTLSTMFPQKNPGHLRDVLKFANYDIEAAVDLLMNGW